MCYNVFLFRREPVFEDVPWGPAMVSRIITSLINVEPCHQVINIKPCQQTTNAQMTVFFEDMLIKYIFQGT